MSKLGSRKRRRIIAASCAIAVVAAMAMAAWCLAEPEENGDEVIWREYPVTRGDVTAALEEGGKVESKRLLQCPAVDVTIEDVFVEAGQEVSEGDILATFSKQELRKRIEELRVERESVWGYPNANDEYKRIGEEIERAKKLLENPVLAAQASGVVLETPKNPGDGVGEDEAAIILGDPSEKTVSVQVAQEDIGSVEIGQEVEMQFSASPGETLFGKVVGKSSLPVEDSDEVAYKVTVAFDEPQPHLMEGMTCSARLIIERVEDVLVIDNKAIDADGAEQTVKVRGDDGEIEMRRVSTGFSNGRVSELLEGLAEGDVALVEG